MFGKKKKHQDETGLEPGSGMSAPRLSSLDIQQKEFRLAFRGYREKDVDLFLDQLTEEFTRLSEENKRVRGGAGIPVVAADNSAADDIRRRAQEEAAAILADARARAASIDAQAGGGVAPVAAANTAGVQSFLTEEREFLHGMASMIQKHAETIRTTAKSVQQEVASATAAAAAAAPTGAHELSQAEADAVAVFSAPTEQDATDVDEDAEPDAEPDAGSDAEHVEDAASEAPAATEAASAWAATASSVPATPEPEVAAPEDVVSIPPSSIDSPAEVPAEPVMAEEAPQDKRSLRELFWGED